MKTVREQIFGGVAAALLCAALLVSAFVLVGSIAARLHAAESLCGVYIRQFQDVVWLSFLAVTTLGLTGLSLASKYKFYPRVCRLSLLASFLTSFTSLVLVGNH
jgi:hypothetical protein